MTAVLVVALFAVSFAYGKRWADDRFDQRLHESASETLEQVSQVLDRAGTTIHDLREANAYLIEELERVRSLVGYHDPTGADHLEETTRLIEENSELLDAKGKLIIELHELLVFCGKGIHPGHHKEFVTTVMRLSESYDWNPQAFLNRRKVNP